jgi:hypothetical protein
MNAELIALRCRCYFFGGRVGPDQLERLVGRAVPSAYVCVTISSFAQRFEARGDVEQLFVNATLA